VPAHLVEEVAREFQLDEIEPTAPVSFRANTQQTMDARLLLQNLDELLGRLRQANLMPTASQERKP